jgi:hypothetical protein
VRNLERQIAEMERVAETGRVRLAGLAAPDLADVALKGQVAAPGASGRAFWSASRGLVFAASGLPPLPDGRTYQVWYLTKGAPVSAGLIKPDADGRAAGVFDAPEIVGGSSGFAVSIEPDGGVPSPTRAIYLAGLRP